MSEITKEQAIALYETRFWETLTHRQIAEFQMRHRRLCMPFDVFHEAIEKTLGRPVFTHEFGLAWDALEAELRGDRLAPTLEEVVGMIPEEKRAVVLLV